MGKSRDSKEDVGMKIFSTIKRASMIAVLLAFSGMALHAQMNDLAVNKAVEFIKLLQKGDYASAYQRVDSNLGFKLSPEKLGAVWQNLTAKAGAVQEFKDAKVENQSGYMIVTQVVKFAKGHVDIKIALDNSLKVADMRFVNHQSSTKSQAQTPAAQPKPEADGQAQATQPASPTETPTPAT
jgi:hypothetical protein